MAKGVFLGVEKWGLSLILRQTCCFMFALASASHRALTEDSPSSYTAGVSRRGDLGKHGPAFHPGQNFTKSGSSDLVCLKERV